MKKTILLLDTETTSLKDGVYDIGYIITDKQGRIRQERNWLVEEIFTDAKQMMGAFYAKKLFTHYAPMLQNGEIRLTPWLEIIETLRQDCIEYGVNIVSAYNLAFDMRVMKGTHTQLGHTDKILPHAMDKLCIWKFAKVTKCAQKLYYQTAQQQRWRSKTGKSMGTTAEQVYRYISGNWDAIEDHTALSDCFIENDILRSCFASKKQIPYNHIEDKYRPRPKKGDFILKPLAA